MSEHELQQDQPVSEYPHVERRHRVLTDADLDAIVTKIAAHHACQFTAEERAAIRDSVKVVAASKRAAFWIGMIFMGSLITVAAGAFAIMMWKGFVMGIHNAFPGAVGNHVPTTGGN